MDLQGFAQIGDLTAESSMFCGLRRRERQPDVPDLKRCKKACFEALSKGEIVDDGPQRLPYQPLLVGCVTR